LTLNNLSIGVHRLKAVSTDSGGETNESNTAWIMVRPFNDDFANSQILTGAQVQFTAYPLYATGEPGEPRHLAGVENRSVWFSWSPPTQGVASIDSFNYSTPVVYRGDRLDQLVRVAGGTNNQTQFAAEAGVSYHIAINSDSRDPWTTYEAGSTLVEVGVRPAPRPAVTNDAFANATIFSGYDATLVSYTDNASREPGEPTPNEIFGNRSVWFGWQTPFSGLARISLDPARLGLLAVYRGSALTNLARIGLSIYGNIEFPADAGATYWIAVEDRVFVPTDGYDFSLRLYQVRPRMVAPVAGEILLGRDGVRLLAEMAEAPTHVMKVEFFNGNAPLGAIETTPFELVWNNPTAGQVELWARATDDAGNVSDSLRVTVFVRPANDDFTDRSVLLDPTGLTNGSTQLAALEPGESIAQNAGTNSVWFEWRSPGEGRLRVQSNAGLSWPDFSRFVPRITIAEGAALDMLNVLAVGRQSLIGGLWPPLLQVVAETPVSQGRTYQICVQGETNISGTFGLSWQFLPRASNDDFARRLPLTAPYTAGSNVGATHEPGELGPATNSLGKSVWWTWLADDTGNASIKLTGRFTLSVLVGSALDHLLPVATGAEEQEYVGGVLTPVTRVSFQAVRGVTYQVAVADVDGLENEFTLLFQPPTAAPRIDPQSTSWSANASFSFAVTGRTGQAFVLQASSDLIAWETVLIDTLQAEPLGFIEPLATSEPYRFYRVVPLGEALEAPLSLPQLRLSVSGASVLRVLGRPGQPYQLEASTDLKTWEAIADGLLTGSGTEIVDTAAETLAWRFYRLRPWH